MRGENKRIIYAEATSLIKYFREKIATAFRKKIYSTIEELQANVNMWLDYYNNHRPHSGKYCYGKTPMQTWNDSLYPAKEKVLNKQYQTVSRASPPDAFIASWPSAIKKPKLK